MVVKFSLTQNWFNRLTNIFNSNGAKKLHQMMKQNIIEREKWKSRKDRHKVI